MRAHESYRDMRDRLLNENSDVMPTESNGDEAVSDEQSKQQVKEELNTAEKRVLRQYNAAEALASRKLGDGDQSSGTEVEKDRRELELDLIKQLMDLTVKLEAEARELLLECMDHGIPRTLLLADRNGESSVRTVTLAFSLIRIAIDVSTNTRCESGTRGRREHPLHLARHK